MDIRATCSECKAIAEELAMAYAEAWDTADPATRRAWTAIQKMRTEEDVQQAEALLQSRPGPNLQRPLGVNDALRWLKENPVMRVLLKKYAHELRTGHTVDSRRE